MELPTVVLRTSNCSTVDELYRSGVKPWHSANWKPHLTDQLHKEEAAETKYVEVVEKQSA
ncbi:hypothetical protein C0995_001740 [Termitomyces sp. Mi166|nr:hypothetical protein C0995_001740 [Termitomyces sp. Mi166\